MGTEFSEHTEIFIPSASQTYGFDQPDTWTQKTNQQRVLDTTAMIFVKLNHDEEPIFDVFQLEILKTFHPYFCAW